MGSWDGNHDGASVPPKRVKTTVPRQSNTPETISQSTTTQHHGTEGESEMNLNRLTDDQLWNLYNRTEDVDQRSQDLLISIEREMDYRSYRASRIDLIVERDA